jgi:hypothetical protein
LRMENREGRKETAKSPRAPRVSRVRSADRIPWSAQRTLRGVCPRFCALSDTFCHLDFAAMSFGGRGLGSYPLIHKMGSFGNPAFWFRCAFPFWSRRLSMVRAHRVRTGSAHCKNMAPDQFGSGAKRSGAFWGGKSGVRDRPDAAGGSLVRGCRGLARTVPSLELRDIQGAAEVVRRLLGAIHRS